MAANGIIRFESFSMNVKIRIDALGEGGFYGIMRKLSLLDLSELTQVRVNMDYVELKVLVEHLGDVAMSEQIDRIERAVMNAGLPGRDSWEPS